MIRTLPHLLLLLGSGMLASPEGGQLGGVGVVVVGSVGVGGVPGLPVAVTDPG